MTPGVTNQVMWLLYNEYVFITFEMKYFTRYILFKVCANEVIYMLSNVKNVEFFRSYISIQY